MNPQQNSFSTPLDAQNKQKKLIKYIIIGAIAMVLIMLVTVLFGGGSSSNGRLGTILARNTEVIRILSDHKKNVKSAELKQKIARVEIILISDSATLTKLGAISDPAQSLAVKVVNIDSNLTDATTNNRLDATLKEFLDSEIALNIDQTQLAIENASTESAKTSLQIILQNLQNL